MNIKDNITFNSNSFVNGESKNFFAERFVDIVLFGSLFAIIISLIFSDKRKKFTLSFYVPYRANIKITVTDPESKYSKLLVNDYFTPGNYKFNLDLKAQVKGIYTYKITGESGEQIFEREIKVFVTTL
jgi:hypothetical protein